MSGADIHQRAHLARLAAVQNRLQALSDKALERHISLCEALYAEQASRYPNTFPIPRNQSPAWWHWNYVASAAITTEIVEANRELRARAAARRDDGILRGKHLNHSVIG